MKYDITRLTFFDDPLTYQARSDEIAVSVPTGISSIEALTRSVGESVGCPVELDISWWNTLFHILLYWSNWRTTPRRVVILHHDLPTFDPLLSTWYNLQSYLHMLIDLMIMLQEENARQADPAKKREMTVVFPSSLSEEIHAALCRNPPWNIILGFSDWADMSFPDFPIMSGWEPDWSTVLHYLHYLDGLTTQICALSREDIGYMSVYYRRENATYSIEYHQPGEGPRGKIASVEEDPSLFTGLSFTLVSQVLETFFTEATLSSSVHWLTHNDVDWDQRLKMHGTQYYRSDEEALLESNRGMLCETIREGMQEVVCEHGTKAFSLDYWRAVLVAQDIPVNKRLTALCIIGLVDPSEATALLRPFLRSPEKRERWVSATILGMWQEEEVLPILLSMLTDELPFKREEEMQYDAWYDCWRLYVPRLLRRWQAPEIGAYLRAAIVTWIQAEPFFDPQFDAWETCEEVLCYELGYRETLSVLEFVELEGKQTLQNKVQEGSRAKKLANKVKREGSDISDGKTMLKNLTNLLERT